MSEYLTWLDEMNDQQRPFTPYETDNNLDRVFNLVKGQEPKKVFTTDSNYDLFNNRLNIFNKSVTDGNVEQQFIELFWLATERLCREKLNIQ